MIIIWILVIVVALVGVAVALGCVRLIVNNKKLKNSIMPPVAGLVVTVVFNISDQWNHAVVFIRDGIR